VCLGQEAVEVRRGLVCYWLSVLASPQSVLSSTRTGEQRCEAVSNEIAGHGRRGSAGQRGATYKIRRTGRLATTALCRKGRNGCDPTPTETKVSDDTTRIRYTCPGRADVELYASEGAGHTWPGSKASAAVEQFIGPTTLEISANKLMREFFPEAPAARFAALLRRENA